ncbi:MAG: YkgJ family cysteine cluster protein [Deltaproteobacteria bacterium]|nr:YkgJ family cysteine cluster protein [Deltaproteobacteria bacterium]
MIDQALMQPMPDRIFRFACNKALPCFTKCCANLNLVLTPYDVLRLKNRLNLSSEAFLEKYTTSYIDEAYGVPVVKLKMNNDEIRRCPFVSPEGCAIYEDRPGACRLYPLGRAASKIFEGHPAGEYYFVVKESHCLGFNEKQEWTVQEWIINQGMDEYNAMNDSFMNITAGRRAKTIKALSDQQLQMFYMACYSLDEFRRFIFETTFLDKFDITKDVRKRIKTDETELMAFACQWLKFSLFGEKTIPIISHHRA